MANFSMFEDDDFGDLFITQTPRSEGSNNVVSLEEIDGFKSVKDPQYSDISDVDEDEAMERRLR